MAERVKLSSEEQEEVVRHAMKLHEDTGGAPVEVSNGSFKAKIGPWPDKEIREAVRDLARTAADHFTKRTGN